MNVSSKHRKKTCLRHELYNGSLRCSWRKINCSKPKWWQENAKKDSASILLHLQCRRHLNAFPLLVLFATVVVLLWLPNNLNALVFLNANSDLLTNQFVCSLCEDQPTTTLSAYQAPDSLTTWHWHHDMTSWLHFSRRDRLTPSTQIGSNIAMRLLLRSCGRGLNDGAHLRFRGHKPAVSWSSSVVNGRPNLPRVLPPQPRIIIASSSFSLLMAYSSWALPCPPLITRSPNWLPSFMQTRGFKSASIARSQVWLGLPFGRFQSEGGLDCWCDWTMMIFIWWTDDDVAKEAQSSVSYGVNCFLVGTYLAAWWQRCGRNTDSDT